MNLAPAIRDIAVPAFAEAPAIQWHAHANHGLSSQVCCVNFLLPMAHQPRVLARWLAHVLDIAEPEMLPIERRAGQDWFVAFEWIGDRDYLNESGPAGTRTRGANATAADAAVKFRTADGSVELVLIEWKYTEEYRGHRLSADRRQTRIKRYRDLAFFPNGPIKEATGLDLTDFFHEPFYQLLRQQMLAWHVEHDPQSGVDRARVLHLSPAGNSELHHVTAARLRAFGEDAFAAFAAVLKRPEDFVGRSIEQAFAPLADWPDADWFAWLQSRYPGLCPSPDSRRESLSAEALVLDAALFAAEKHRHQQRKGADASPYINHPLALARTLAVAGITDPVILCAALLHDTVEDTDTSFDELEQRFGPQVASVVREVTDDKSLDKPERKRLQVEKAASKSREAKLVKLADKISNLGDIRVSPPKNWSRERQADYFAWAARVVDGIRGTEPRLEAEFDRLQALGRQQFGEMPA
jgi:hypothetical protein